MKQNANSEVVIALLESKALIKDRAAWCQGEHSMWNAYHMKQHCAEGALFAIFKLDGIGIVDTNLYESAYSFLRLAALHIQKKLDPNLDPHSINWGQVWYVNDSMGHEATMEMYDHAIYLARLG